MAYIRLQKLIARRGYTSRRKAEQLIKDGRVCVNGTVLNGLGVRVDENSTVEIDGRPVDTSIRTVYIMLNKPPGYLCSRHDPSRRPLIYDLIPNRYRRLGLFSVGRLDFLSEGLLLITNDGDFAQSVIHPSSNILKRYVLESNRSIQNNLIDDWKKGVYINGELFSIKNYRRLSPKKYEIVLSEGKNREIRKLCAYSHIKVVSLKRVAIGSLGLGSLPAGKCRELDEQERALLFK